MWEACDVEFRVLGPLECLVAGQAVDLGRPKQRAVLAVLLSARDRAVPVEGLIDLVWGDEPPERARHSVQQYVSRLRRVFAGTAGVPLILSEAAGYRLAVDPSASDAARFQTQVAAGRQALAGGDVREGRDTLASALALWRGPAYADLLDEPFPAAEAARLEELRLGTLEDRVGADLLLGQGPELIAELHELVRLHPLRERFWEHLMVALYQAGRQAEALRTFQQVRRLLADELGLEPGEALRTLEDAILRHALPVPRANPAEIVRADGGAPDAGLVCVLFTDLVGWTALGDHLGDEAADAVRRAHFDAARAAVSKHGGRQVKTAGDSVMAVFRSAVEALGAALVIQEPSDPPGPPVRIGIHAGEPIADEGDYYGTAVNTASRLCDAAPAGAVLVSGVVRSLVGRRGGFEFEPAGTMTLKGLEEPLATFRVRRVAGRPAAATLAGPEDRRTVTVVAARLSGLEALETAAGLRTVQLVVADARARALAAVDEHRGTVIPTEDGAVVAFFGVPAADEDDPARAVRCALRIRDEWCQMAAEVARAWDLDPPVTRVSVSSDDLFGDPGTGMGAMVAGRAEGLRDAAPPDCVVVGAAVRALVEPLFEWGEPGEGQTTVVTRDLHLGGRLRGLPGRRAPLVGREAAVADTERMLARLREGGGGILVVIGEAGMGKTRLLEEIRARSEATGAPTPWLDASCPPDGWRFPYGPFRQLLRSWLGTSPVHPDLRVRVTARERLEALAGDEAEALLPAVIALLGVRPDPATAERLGWMEADTRREAIAHALARVLILLGEQTGVVVALDDLHWADTASLDLLVRLLDVTSRAAVLFVVAARPEPAHRSWDVREEIRRRFGHRSSEIVLSALGDGADAALLRALLHEATLSSDVERRLLDAAEGNPFFLEEIVRSIMAAGAVRRRGDQWELAGEVAVEIPASVEQVIVSRLDRLPVLERQLLGAASVLGREFRSDLLARVSGTAADDTEFTAATDDLERLELLREVRRRPHHVFRFEHPLIREAAYRALPAERRRELHHRAARGIEVLHLDRTADVYAVLAHHCEEGGEVDRAAAYRRLAGDEALAVHALDAAQREYESGIVLAEDHPASVPAEVTAGLYFGLGRSLRLSGELEDAKSSLARAAEAAGNSGVPELLVGVLEEQGTLAQTAESIGAGQRHFARAVGLASRSGLAASEVTLRNRMAVGCAAQLDFRRAHEHARQALTVASGIEDLALQARAIDGAKLVAWYLGDLDELERLVAEAEPVLRASHQYWYLQFAIGESAYAAAGRGRWPEALARVEEALTINARIGDRAERPGLLMMAAGLHRMRGHLGSVLDVAAEAVTIAGEVGVRWWEAWAECELGAALVDLGAPAEAVPHLIGGREAAESCDAAGVQLRSSAHLARAHVLLHDPVAAKAVYGRGMELLATISVPAGSAYLAGGDSVVALADVAATLGGAEPIREALAALLAAARRARHLPAIATCARALARQVAAQDRHRLLLEALEAAGAGRLPLEAFACHAALAKSLDDHAAATYHLESASLLVEELTAAAPAGDLGRLFADGLHAVLRSVV